jgi:two-component system, OmpR family, sensor histidine kinase BaeS
MRKRHFRDWHHNPPPWDASRPIKSRFLFLRFLFTVIPMLALFIAGFLVIFGLIFQPLREIYPHPEVLVGLICGIPLVFGLVALFIGSFAFRRFSSPVAEIMAAADAVADGDLSVRVREEFHGEFGKMAKSFNRMTAKLSNVEQQRRIFTADVAHELRTPLHIIQGNLEGILDGVYESTDDQIRATLDETRILTRLVNDLQTLSLAEAGKLLLHRELVSAIDLVEDALTSFSGLAVENKIELKSEIIGTESELTLNADPDRIGQVLSNLVANAVRFTPPGGTITLRAERIPSCVQLVVEDTGSGITPEDLPYVFDRFWKAEHARSRHEGTGSGLGLAIARQLVQAHGGSIHAESSPGVGTKFVIDLPLSEE